MKTFGGIAFIVGLVLAVIVALFGAGTVPIWSVLVLGLLGLIVGLLNVKDKEINMFLIASIAFMISFTALSNLFTMATLGWGAVAAFFGLMNVFVAPAAAVVAIKALYDLAKD